jgi:hypothetical protein
MTLRLPGANTWGPRGVDRSQATRDEVLPKHGSAVDRFSGRVGQVMWKPRLIPNDPRLRRRDAAVFHGLPGTADPLVMRGTAGLVWAVHYADTPLILYPASFMQSSACTSVANAYLVFDPPWQYRKRSSIGGMITVVLGEVANFFAGTVLQPGSSAYLAIADEAAALSYGSIYKSFLGTLWNQYNCSDQSVTAGPYLLPRGSPFISPSNPAAGLTCMYLPWDISFDGGASWHTVQLWTCWRSDDE